MQTEKDREKLLCYLSVFRKAELPEVTDFILSLAASDDWEIRSAAIEALANVAHPTVRELALKLLNEGKPDAIALFKKNYVEGDFRRIFVKFHTFDDADHTHAYGLDILNICDNHNGLDAVDCLLWLYENTPCALCRSVAVNKLMKIDRLPQALARECLCDCYEDTRNEVSNSNS